MVDTCRQRPRTSTEQLDGGLTFEDGADRQRGRVEPSDFVDKRSWVYQEKRRPFVATHQRLQTASTSCVVEVCTLCNTASMIALDVEVRRVWSGYKRHLERFKRPRLFERLD